MTNKILCPCGSRNAYRLCCGKNPVVITPQSVNAAVQSDLDRIQQSENRATDSLKFCCWPGCDSKNAIRAHIISQSFLRRIASKNHLMHFRHLIDDVRSRNKRDGNPKSIGIKKAITYFGFCDDHDNYFHPIDGDWAEAKNNYFLHSLRIASFNYFQAKLNFLRALESEGEYKLKNTQSPSFVDNRIASTMHEYFRFDVFTNAIAKSKLDRMYFEDDYSDIETYVCYFEKDIPISAAMTYPCFIYFDGNRQKVSVYDTPETPQVHLTLLPLSKGGVLLVTWHKDVSAYARIQWETFNQIPSDKKTDALLRMLFHWSGGTVLNPLWWNKLSIGKKRYLSQIVKSYWKLENHDLYSAELISPGGRFSKSIDNWEPQAGNFHL